MLSADVYGPLDVAIATIKNNHHLVTELREDLLYLVITIMDKMTKLDTNSTPSSSPSRSNKVSLIHRDTVNSIEWDPAGAEKCLKFLQAAVCVNSKLTLIIIIDH